MRESSWDTLTSLSRWYNGVSRGLRRSYKWDPSIIDAIPVDRLVKIYDEMIDDFEQRKSEFNEEDFE